MCGPAIMACGTLCRNDGSGSLLLRQAASHVVTERWTSASYSYMHDVHYVVRFMYLSSL